MLKAEAAAQYTVPFGVLNKDTRTMMSQSQKKTKTYINKQNSTSRQMAGFTVRPAAGDQKDTSQPMYGGEYLSWNKAYQLHSYKVRLLRDPWASAEMKGPWTNASVRGLKDAL